MTTTTYTHLILQNGGHTIRTTWHPTRRGAWQELAEIMTAIGGVLTGPTTLVMGQETEQEEEGTP